MKHMTNQDLERAFVPVDGPRLADIVPTIESHEDLSATRRRDLISSLRVVSRTIGWLIEEIPADAAWLRRKLDRIAPAAHGITSKRWNKVLSDLKAALRAAGIAEHVQGARGCLSADWQALKELAGADMATAKVWHGISRFAKFCSNLGIVPTEVADETLVAFGHALELSEIRKKPAVTMYSAATSWNRACEQVPDWPGSLLAVPQRNSYYSLPLDEFPQGFHLDLERYLARMRGDDLFGDGPDRPLAPATIDSHARMLRRFASALVQSGTSITEITGLADLVSIDAFKAGLKGMADRAGTTRSAGLSNMAKLLVSMARHYVGVDPAHAEELARLAQRVAPGFTKGLTSKNRDRLRTVFLDRNLDVLLDLPSRLERRAAKEDTARKAAVLIETALAIEILLNTAIRRKNLAMIRVDRNLRRSGRKGRDVHLVFEEAEVKNDMPLDKPLPDRTVALLDKFLNDHRDVLVTAPSPWLFSRRDGAGPIDPGNFGKRLSKTILDETGIDVNPHLFRHIAAKLYLDANPDGYAAVRLLLGHSRESSTIDAYAGLDGTAAARAFDQIVRARRGEHK